MNILLTNDDGIHALGLCAIYESLRADGHKVTVVAPSGERSAVGHALTISDPIKVKRVFREGEEFGWAVNGTPADCVKLAVNSLLDERPNIVVSGINRGANVGINVLYSGTVSAATEAAILGIKAIAISIDSFSDLNYCYAAFVVKDIIKWFYKTNTKCKAINVNIPSLPAHKIAGIKITRQSISSFNEKFEKRIDPRGNIYFWQCESSFKEIEKDTDIYWLKKGFITITPIKFDLTDYSCITQFFPPPIN